MNQNPAVDNDLQKAIDDITKNTNTDPVFSDPIAAPSSVPENDSGVLAEPVGPFPEPISEPIPEPTPEPVIAESVATESIVPPLQSVSQATEPVEPTHVQPAEIAPEPIPEPIAEPQPVAPIPEPTAVESTSITEVEPTQNLGMRQVKEAALRDLAPLLAHLDITPSQRFNLYRNIFEELKDYTVLESAYRAALEIQNEKERAEALLYLVESIDNM